MPSPRKTDANNVNDTTEQTSLGLPHDWTLVPIPRANMSRRTSVSVRVFDDSSLDTPPILQRSITLTGRLELDWSRLETEPQTSADPSEVPSPDLHITSGTLTSSTPDEQRESHEESVQEAICFRIAVVGTLHDYDDTQLPFASQALRRQPEMLSGYAEHEIRRETRRLIRVVTRNTMGLMTTAALSGVAPELLIAAVINAYCLARGLRDLEEHRKQLAIHGLTIRRRDVSIAVAEGAIVKLAVMVITVNHSDFIVFTNTFAAPLTKTVELIHQAILGNVPILDDVSHAFDLPTQQMQHVLGLDEVTSKAADLTGTSAWSVPTKQLLENTLIVGTVQAGMEGVVERVQEHVGGWAKWCRTKYDHLLGRHGANAKPSSPSPGKGDS